MTYEKKSIDLKMKYPAIEDLAQKARTRIPHVAWEYLQTGTGREELIQRNLDAIQNVRLSPQFCKGALNPTTETTLFGQRYNAPFGIAPVGLTGLMWPRAEVILAKTANKYRIPYSLSTVATETPETVGPHVGDMGWFQLYPPREEELRKAFINRAWKAGFRTLIITADVPTPSRRERTKRAGLAMPPKMTLNFIWQGMTHPVWSFHTLKNGLPRLRTIESYSEFNTMMSVGAFTRDRLGGNLSWEHCKALRDEWQGPVIVKGLLHPKDAETAVGIGMDGIVVSNHGGRQFDGAPASMEALPEIVRAVKGKTAILFDSGIRSGLDILRALKMGADFVLLGRSFIYGVAALGKYGGDHVAEILMEELKNNMVQLGIENLSGSAN
ncbi:MAG: alpha-hydroxy acid oxidase [Bacteroidota bacterium]